VSSKEKEIFFSCRDLNGCGREERKNSSITVYGALIALKRKKKNKKASRKNLWEFHTKRRCFIVGRLCKSNGLSGGWSSSNGSSFGGRI